MRSKRWLVVGISASCFAASFIPACGSDTFTSVSNDASVFDGSSSDVAMIDDAGADAVSDAPFCSTQSTAILCADFDEADLRSAYLNGGGPPVLFFGSMTPTGGGNISTTHDAVSPPTAYEAQLLADAGPPSADGGTVESAEGIGFLSEIDGATHYRLEAQLRFNRLESVTAAAPLTLLGMQLTTTAGQTNYALDIRLGHWWVDVFQRSGSASVAGQLDLGAVPAPSPTWLPIVVDITFGGTGKITASIAGHAVSSTTASLTTGTDNTPTLVIGPSTNGGTDIIDVSYDNVVLFADDAGSN